MKLITSLVLAAIAALACHLMRTPEPTVLSLRIDQTFDEVERASSFPVRTASKIPSSDAYGFGTTWVTQPAVIIRFDDPIHGFTLPPTKFAAIAYYKNKVITIATTPTLYKLSFDQAITRVISLQNQFKAGGWQPENGTNWFDVSLNGQLALRRYIRDINNGYVKTALLVVPRKYEMTFRLYCADRCDSNIGLDRYLIDIGVGEDIGFQIQEKKQKTNLN
jgi:hypothetical protein